MINPHSQREIIDVFVKEINENKQPIEGAFTTIFFRNDKSNKIRRQVYSVPIIYLKFRKNNGRISSDVIAYEKRYGEIKEATDLGQQILRNFLLEKDKEKSEEL